MESTVEISRSTGTQVIQHNEHEARPDSLRELTVAELFATAGGTATNTYF
jgi:hypothetical protein